jgi:hypothetical protein
MALSRPASLHDILTAWQAGAIGYREALERAKLDSLEELYEAAELSGVALSTDLDPTERDVARRIGQVLRDLRSEAA